MNDLKALLKRQIKAPPTILAWRKLSSRLQIIALSMTSKNWFLFTLKNLIFIYFREALMPPALSPALLGEGGVEIHKNPWKSMEISFRSCHPCRIFIKLFWIMAKPPWFWDKAVAGHSWSLFSVLCVGPHSCSIALGEANIWIYLNPCLVITHDTVQ